MNNLKLKNNATQNLKRTLFIKIIPLLLLQFSLGACATNVIKGEAIEDILQKENILIEKLKLERASPEIQQELEKSASLKRAEPHLLLSLDEIKKANEAITDQILKTKREENKNERVHAKFY